MKNTQPLGNPKYNKGLAEVNCNKNISISCDDTDNRILVLKENDEICEKMLASSVLLCVKNSQAECQAVADYRRANDFQKPYVNIKFYKADCSKKHYEVGNYSVFPKEGQTVEELQKQLLELVNACNDCNCPEPTNSLPFYDDTKVKNFITQSQIDVPATEKLVPIEPNKKYKIDWALRGFGDFGETLNYTVFYGEQGQPLESIGEGTFQNPSDSSGDWSFDTVNDFPNLDNIFIQILIRSNGGNEVQFTYAFISIQEVAEVII